MDVKMIILGCFVLIILIILYNWFFQDSTRDDLIKVKKADVKLVSPGKKAPFSADWTYSFWVHISNYNYNYGKPKYILFRKNDKSGKAVGNLTNAIYLDEYQSDLVIKTRCTKKGDTNGQLGTCVLKNIPLQRWTHILISYRSRALDVYMDGKLTKTCVTPGNFLPPSGEPTDIWLCPSMKDITETSGATAEGGYKGFLATFRYYKRAVQPREAYIIYKEGYSGGNWLSDLFNKYKLKIAFLEDNNEFTSFVF